VETPDEADSGYPEEAPAEVAGDEGSRPRKGATPPEADKENPPGETDSEADTATGNPKSAG
jgi:hypothetical protein